jgi:hypothetical protein
MVGTRVGGRAFNPGTFDFADRLPSRRPDPQEQAVLLRLLRERRSQEPGTTFRANEGGETVGRAGDPRAPQDLDSLSSFLNNSFSYETGPYQGYDHEVPSAMRLTAKFDYALNDRNKFSFRYTKLDSKTDVLLSNSSSLGFGTRRTNATA